MHFFKKLKSISVIPYIAQNAYNQDKLILFTSCKMPSFNLNTVDGEDVSPLYKGIKSEYLPNVKVNTIYYNNTPYQLAKYLKSSINQDNVLTTGLFRSVIARDGKVLSFAPPKSMDADDFTRKYDVSECYAEEFVDGTMINVFYDKVTKEWVIATKSNIGAKNSFFTNGHITPEDTFSHMFMETCKHVQLSFDLLNKSYQYSFVMQHPKNRIVLDIKTPRLYLISVNEINDDNVVTRVTNIDLHNASVEFPQPYEMKDFHEFEKEWENVDGTNRHDYKDMGVVIVHRPTGNRTKFRNPHYEYVKILRGNQPKIEYRFIELWQEKKVQEFLKYFPEHKTLFDAYWEKLSKFIDNVFNNYVGCYMLKRQALKEYPFECRTFMYELHALYKQQLSQQNKVVTIPITVEYFRTIAPAKILFALNYNMRPKTETTATADEYKNMCEYANINI